MLVIASSLKHQILLELHSFALASHYGFQETYAYAKHSFFWPRMKKGIYRFSSKCYTYKCNKGNPSAPRHNPTLSYISHHLDKYLYGFHSGVSQGW